MTYEEWVGAHAEVLRADKALVEACGDLAYPGDELIGRLAEEQAAAVWAVLIRAVAVRRPSPGAIHALGTLFEQLQIMLQECEHSPASAHADPSGARDQRVLAMEWSLSVRREVLAALTVLGGAQ
jgi:hypothetical protein